MLRSTPGVRRVTPDALVHLSDQSRNVDYLRLSGSTSLWQRLSGQAKSRSRCRGRLIDTGIWPEAASFSGKALGTSAPPSSDRYRPYRVGSRIRMRKADGNLFTGTCETGQRFSAQSCTTKIVGARSFGVGWRAGATAADVDDFSPP